MTLLNWIFVAGLVKALQAVNSSTWQDTFLGLWIAALRLVNRVSIHYWCISLYIDDPVVVDDILGSL